MALFKSGNPTLSESIFSRSVAAPHSQSMTIKGTLAKFGFLLLMVLVGSFYTWNLFEPTKLPTLMTFMWVGIFGGLITGLIVSFKPKWAPYVAPAYGIFEGFFIGGISVIINNAFAETYPGIVLQAVGLTLGVALAMFLLYYFRIIKPTQKFKAIVFSATLGIGLFYLITLVLGMFHVNLPFMYNSSPLGIGISLFVVAIAALNLILDFEQIEVGSKMGAPKFMEWYGAFGLLVTIVWLYIEILKLLSRLANNRS